MPIRFRTDFDKHVVTANLERRGWEQVSSSDDDWDLYWCAVPNVKHLFGVEASGRLQPGQLVNHFPNHYELTRKDLMVKNIKRYQKLARRDGGPAAAEEADIIPTTFVLPQDYMLFVEEFRRAPPATGGSTPRDAAATAAAGATGAASAAPGPNTWIMKPSSKSQGRGIFLINKLSQVKKWSSPTAALPPALRQSQDSYVVSRYIDRPLLIGGKKFDLRLYVLVTSYKPLTAYMSRLGFGRFCNTKYTAEEAELDNEYVHLTNVAIQKHGTDYNQRHGNKWGLDNMRLYLEATRGVAATDRLFRDMERVVVTSLKAVQGVMIHDKHCFELYGYDLLVDAALKPWLIEVNASPSLSTTTPSDRLLKFKVISDALNLVTPPEWVALAEQEAGGAAGLPAPLREVRAAHEALRSGGPIPSATLPKLGSFYLICDEATNKDSALRLRRSLSAMSDGPGSLFGGTAGIIRDLGTGYSDGSTPRRVIRSARVRTSSSDVLPPSGLQRPASSYARS